jgi:hypothetical protein
MLNSSSIIIKILMGPDFQEGLPSGLIFDGLNLVWEMAQH